MRTLFVLFVLFILSCHALQADKQHVKAKHQITKLIKKDQKGQNQKANVANVATVAKVEKVAVVKGKTVNTLYHHLSKGVASPAGGQYTGAAAELPVDDADHVYQPQMDTVKDILSSVTQFDKNDATIYDDDRCGAAVVFAAAINAGKIEQLIDFVVSHASKPDLTTPDATDAAELNRIRTAFTDRSATFGDVGLLQEIIYKYWAVHHECQLDGMVGGQLHNLLVGAGLTPPDTSAMFEARTFSTDNIQPGQSWPYIIHAAGDGDGATYVHWILIGREGTAAAPGTLFIYDPYPMDSSPPLFESPNDGYNTYQTWIWNSALDGSGWAPADQAGADSDIQAEGF